MLLFPRAYSLRCYKPKDEGKKTLSLFYCPFFTMDTRSILMKNLAVIHWDTNDFLAATAKSSKGIYLTYWCKVLGKGNRLKNLRRQLKKKKKAQSDVLLKVHGDKV